MTFRIRPFRNADTPALAELWRGQAGRWFAQPLTTDLLEAGPLARPYFDNAGLLVAEDDTGLVGWTHAGFGPSPDGARLDRSRGTFCPLVVRPDRADDALPAALIAAAEAHLQRHGATEIHALGAPWPQPFYLGLYGGSDVLGPADGLALAVRALQAAGYRERGRFAVLERSLAGFRPPVNRRTMLVRRTCSVQSVVDAPAAWWDSCAYSGVERNCFELWQDGQAVAGVTLWPLEPLSHVRGVRAAGLVRLWTQEGRRRQGLASSLLGEALRHVAAEGYALIEAQTTLDNSQALAAFQAIGFVEVEQGSMLVKSTAPAAAE